MNRSDILMHQSNTSLRPMHRHRSSALFHGLCLHIDYIGRHRIRIPHYHLEFEFELSPSLSSGGEPPYDSGFRRPLPFLSRRTEMVQGWRIYAAFQIAIFARLDVSAKRYMFAKTAPCTHSLDKNQVVERVRLQLRRLYCQWCSPMYVLQRAMYMCTSLSNSDAMFKRNGSLLPSSPW
jgi:hypothetical protein